MTEKRIGHSKIYSAASRIVWQRYFCYQTIICLRYFKVFSMALVPNAFVVFGAASIYHSVLRSHRLFQIVSCTTSSFCHFLTQDTFIILLWGNLLKYVQSTKACLQLRSRTQCFVGADQITAPAFWDVAPLIRGRGIGKNLLSFLYSLLNYAFLLQNF